MVFVIDLDNTPWVRTTAYFAAIESLHKVIRTNHSKWNLASNFFGLSESLLVLVLVRWGLENMDVVLSNVGEDL